MRILGTCGAMILATVAVAQNPDVRIRTDIRLHYRSERAGPSSLRWYDPLARYSLVSVEFGLEPGFRGFISERLQKIPDNADNEQLDEYYVEDPGLWRVGKQYMPFGRQRLVREAARGARGDTNLILESIPVSVAVCDNGSGRTRGVFARAGGRVGVSGAYGNYLGAQSTSLAAVRAPESVNGFGRGYKAIVGVDASRKWRRITAEFELVALRAGMTPLDEDREVSELFLGVDLGKRASLGFAWSRDWTAAVNVFRAEGKLEVYPNFFVEPMVRMRNGRMHDVGVSMRAKL